MSALVHEPIVLPKIAFLSAWNWQGLGRTHPVVGVDENWTAEQVQGGVRERVLRGLSKSGLADQSGPRPPLRVVLSLLARADREFYGWLQPAEDAATKGVLVAGDGADAVTLSVAHNHVRLAPVTKDTLAGELVATLPEAPAADIQPLRLPKSQYAPRQGESAPSSGRHAAPDPGDELAALMRERHGGVHTFYTATSADDGSRVRSAPFTVLDLEGRGRTLTFLSTESGVDDPVINCVSGTADSVASTLESAQQMSFTG